MRRSWWATIVGATLLVALGLPGLRMADAAPAGGPEVPVATGTAAQTTSDAASDGTNRLVVWQEPHAGAMDVYAARVGPDGTRLDPGGIPVATGAGNQHGPSVAFDGVRFLVVWSSGVNGPDDVRAARVSTDGVVLDPSGITVRATAVSETAGGVARSGNGFLVTWVGADVGVRATRVSTGGTVLDASGIAVATAFGASAAAWNGTDTLVVWGVTLSSGHGRELRAARITPAGVVRDSPGILVRSYPGDLAINPDVAAVGSSWLAVTAFGTIATDLDVAGALIGGNGTVVDGDIAMPDSGETEDEATVACTASCLVAWRKNGDIRGARVQADGTVVDNDDIVISDESTLEDQPAAVSGPGGGWSVAYDRPVNGPPENGGRRVFLRAVASK